MLQRILCTSVVTVAMSASVALGVDTEAAKDNFAMFCAMCHGESGHGDGPVAAALKTKPRDLADCKRMGKITDEVLFNVIKEGGQSQGLSSEMAAWANGFEDGEIRDLVAYIRTLCVK